MRVRDSVLRFNQLAGTPALDPEGSRGPRAEAGGRGWLRALEAGSRRGRRPGAGPRRPCAPVHPGGQDAHPRRACRAEGRGSPGLREARLRIPPGIEEVPLEHRSRDRLPPEVRVRARRRRARRDSARGSAEASSRSPPPIAQRSCGPVAQAVRGTLSRAAPPNRRSSSPSPVRASRSGPESGPVRYADEIFQA